MNVKLEKSDEKLSRREREKLAHRREIMDAATRIFARKGFSNATLDEIAREAEFSKGALYLYFSNKEDLLHSIMKEKSAAILLSIKSTLTGESSFKEELHTLFDWFAELTFKEKDFLSILLVQHIAGGASFSEKKEKEFCKTHHKFDEIILNRVKKAVESGELKDIEPESVYGIIHGAMENMMITRWGCGTVKELHYAVDRFIDIIFNGIAKEREVGSEN